MDRGVLTVTARREEEFGEDERVFVRELTMGAFSRRNPRRLRTRETVDFWRVEEIETGRLLRLRAESGWLAWLELAAR